MSATAANMLGALAYAEIQPWISRGSGTRGRNSTRPRSPRGRADPALPVDGGRRRRVRRPGTALTVAVADALVDRGHRHPRAGDVAGGATPSAGDVRARGAAVPPP